MVNIRTIMVNIYIFIFYNFVFLFIYHNNSILFQVDVKKATPKSEQSGFGNYNYGRGGFAGRGRGG